MDYSWLAEKDIETSAVLFRRRIEEGMSEKEIIAWEILRNASPLGSYSEYCEVPIYDEVLDELDDQGLLDEGV